MFHVRDTGMLPVRESQGMSPSDIYTALIALIVVMILITAWALDRIEEGKKRERELMAEIDRLKRRATVKQYSWPTDVR